MRRKLIVASRVDFISCKDISEQIATSARIRKSFIHFQKVKASSSQQKHFTGCHRHFAPRMASRDILIDGQHKIHLSIIPKLALIIVNDLEDIGETWTEVNVFVGDQRSCPLFNVRTLAGDIKTEATCRFLIGALQQGLQKLALPGRMSDYKFIINLSLRPQIYNSPPHMNSLARALVETLEDLQPKLHPHCA